MQLDLKRFNWLPTCPGGLGSCVTAGGDYVTDYPCHAGDVGDTAGLGEAQGLVEAGLHLGIQVDTWLALQRSIDQSQLDHAPHLTVRMAPPSNTSAASELL
jgi:hypothetical protein